MPGTNANLPCTCSTLEPKNDTTLRSKKKINKYEKILSFLNFNNKYIKIIIEINIIKQANKKIFVELKK